jgi:UPF0176 protein
MRLHNIYDHDTLMKRLEESGQQRVTLSFYKYARIGNPAVFRDHLYIMMDTLGVLGRIYVANEGINGQISLPTANLEAFRAYMEGLEGFSNLRLNIAVEDNGKSFYKLDLKVRHKIVADGIDEPDFNPADTGTHLKAEDWNTLMDEPDVLVVDMRNHYESEVGHFEKAILPDCDTFREELDKVVDMLGENRDRKVMMYCTGGIRCEKASAWLKYNGFPNVYQLEGGIIQYAQRIKTMGLPSRFHGKNFVFDERLGERITPEIIAQCHQCGAPADTHVNCANDACHLLFIQCDACREKMETCCSEACREVLHLPAEEQEKIRKAKQKVSGTAHYRGLKKASLKG